MKRLICWFLGHDLWIVQKFTPVSRRVCCWRCKGDFAMNDSVRALVPWDGEFEEFYQSCGHDIRHPKDSSHQ